MEIDKTKVLVAALAFAIALVVVLGIGYANRYSESALDSAVAQAKETVKAEYQNQLEESEKLFQKQIDEKVAEYESSLASKTAELDAKDAALADLNEQLADKEEKEVEDSFTYLIDNVALDGDFEAVLDNSDVERLLDTKIEYDDEKYNVEEKVYLSADVAPMLNLEGFNAEVALGILEDGAIQYKYIFDDSIVVDDDELEIEFLGQPLNIISFDGSELEYRTSELFEGVPGDEKEVDGLSVKIVDISEKSIIVSVDGVSKIVEEGKVEKVNGLRIEVDEIFASDFSNYVYAKLFVGDEISDTVESGDEYTADDKYEWLIGSDFIGVTLAERYDDEDEAFKLGEGISLPNDYVSFKFDEVKGLEYLKTELKISGNELAVKFDGDIEVDGKRLDSSKIDVDLDTLEYTYEYKDDKYTETDFSKIAFVFDDRDSFSIEVTADKVKLVGSDGELYVFKYEDNKFVLAKQDASEMNDKEDYLLVNGDLLYSSEVNEDDGAKDVEIGLIKDLDEVEAVLAVN